MHYEMMIKPQHNKVQQNHMYILWDILCIHMYIQAINKENIYTLLFIYIMIQN